MVNFEVRRIFVDYPPTRNSNLYGRRIADQPKASHAVYTDQTAERLLIVKGEDLSLTILNSKNSMFTSYYTDHTMDDRVLLTHDGKFPRGTSSLQIYSTANDIEDLIDFPRRQFPTVVGPDCISVVDWTRNVRFLIFQLDLTTRASLTCCKDLGDTQETSQLQTDYLVSSLTPDVKVATIVFLLSIFEMVSLVLVILFTWNLKDIVNEVIKVW